MLNTLFSFNECYLCTAMSQLKPGTTEIETTGDSFHCGCKIKTMSLLAHPMKTIPNCLTNTLF